MTSNSDGTFKGVSIYRTLKNADNVRDLSAKDTLTCMMKSAFFLFIPFLLMRLKKFAIPFQMIEFVFKSGTKKIILHSNTVFISPAVSLCLQKTTLLQITGGLQSDYS